YGYADEDIENMSARQRKREAMDARAEGIDVADAMARFKRPRPQGQKSSPEASKTTPVSKPSTRAAPIKVETADDVRALAPAQPTPAQAKAENYRHEHIEVEALGLTGRRSISVETGAGGIRRGTDANGKDWEVRMAVPYGRIKGTKG